ncbi:hypothetical protein [Blastococcus atacamensis]|uniref:hypothetical protein n=1 Tax=Blastococcus atacamensis TaxID=2070508 RepID=UPI000CECAB79|nr:hypothetical protein [Blastococcus atacamensis]
MIRRVLNRAPELGYRLGVAAAAGFTVLSAESVIRPGPQNYRDVLWLVPGLLTMGTFACVHRAHAGGAGRWERVSYGVAQVALVLTMTATAAWGLGFDGLAFLGFPLGALAWMAGLISWGSALIRAGVLPASAGWSLILLEPGSIAAGVALSPIAGLADHGGYSGALAKAVALAAVSVALRRWAAAAPGPGADGDAAAVPAGTGGQRGSRMG